MMTTLMTLEPAAQTLIFQIVSGDPESVYLRVA